MNYLFAQPIDIFGGKEADLGVWEFAIGNFGAVDQELGGAAFAGFAAVLGEVELEGVVELAGFIDGIDDPAGGVVVVNDEGGEGFHLVGGEPTVSEGG